MLTVFNMKCFESQYRQHSTPSCIFPVTSILLIRCFYTYSTVINTYILVSHMKNKLFMGIISRILLFPFCPYLKCFSCFELKLENWLKLIELIWYFEDRLREFGLVWINFENFIWNLIHRKVCSMKQDRSNISADFSMGFWIICAI